MLPGKITLGCAGVIAVLGGCASTPGPGPVAAPAEAPSSLKSASQSAGPAGGYTLTAEELALDCRKLTGRIQVRILQIRDYSERPGSTGLSHVAQTATTAVLGGTKEGADPASRYARDRAVLEAYNNQLAAKGCPTFNLVAELKPRGVMETPSPVAKTSAPNEPKSE
jgi:hypothetical protein